MSLERLIDDSGANVAPGDLYTDLNLPAPPDDRPYLFINMVATVDGKTLQAPRGSTAKGLGSKTDQLLMHRLEQQADGIIIGAQTLRLSHVIYPPDKWRATITRSGRLPVDNKFFTDAPGKAVVFAPKSLPESEQQAIGTAATLRLVGEDSADPVAAAAYLRRDCGIRHLLLEGGATVNFDFLSAGLVDEMFLTVAPKLKGGAQLPTVVDGPGLPDGEFVSLRLVSLYRDGSELYLRYRTGS